MAFIFVVSSVSYFVLWLFSVRPYCRKHGKGYTTGANVGVALWVNWQEAGEIARKRNDKGMIAVCRGMLVLQLIAAGVIGLMMTVGF